MITIKEVESLSVADRRSLFQWGSNIWGSHGLKGKLSVEQPWRRFIRYVDDVAVSHVGLVTSKAYIDGTPYVLAGLGGIVTNRDYQHQGHATILTREVLARLDRGGFHDLAMIFCLHHRLSFYVQNGWIEVPGEITVEVEQASGRVVVGPPTHVCWRPLRFPLPTGKRSVQIEGRPW